MNRIWGRSRVVMGAFVLAGGLAAAQGRGQKPREESPQVCEAECKADVKDCTALCQQRTKTSASECVRLCNMMAQECAQDCRQGGKED